MSATPFEAWSLPGHSSKSPPESRAPEDEPGILCLEVDPAWIEELAGRLRGGGVALRGISVREVVEALGTVGARFLDPDDPLRARALGALPATSGLSPEMASAVLDGMAANWTREGLDRLLEADLPDVAALDRFVGPAGARVRAMGPELCVQIVSGSVPGVGATALLRSLLLKAPTLVKPGRGDVVLPVLLAEALREVDPTLSDAVAVVYWPGGDAALEKAALDAADVVTAYGGDEAVGDLRARTPVTTRFVGYHHRVSYGLVGRAGLDERHRHQVASEVAGAVAFFDQRGCVSPQVIFVEEGGDVTPARFAAELAGALDTLEVHLPGGLLDAREASAVHQLRGTAELLAASSAGVQVFHGDRRSWTVIYDPSATLDLYCVGRVARIRPVTDLHDVPELIRPVASHLQTVAVAGLPDDGSRIAEGLARVGATRITGFDAAPFPPPGWHHDGQGPLGALVRWVDLEV